MRRQFPRPSFATLCICWLAVSTVRLRPKSSKALPPVNYPSYPAGDMARDGVGRESESLEVLRILLLGLDWFPRLRAASVAVSL